MAPSFTFRSDLRISWVRTRLQVIWLLPQSLARLSATLHDLHVRTLHAVICCHMICISSARDTSRRTQSLIYPLRG
ncbi:hypothetical protein FA13DRAFT_656207 [Coprinellus micaceus]|uniref:Uncharacterized protein n=1 Tax=Coprinellus micaceus TaxID=71717 RepID=A0A4Y7SAV7_COPMI|nr:hypothetical protein FA13DRAFT_656207 [Coprinellus micaceus]